MNNYKYYLNDENYEDLEKDEIHYWKLKILGSENLFSSVVTLILVLVTIFFTIVVFKFIFDFRFMGYLGLIFFISWTIILFFWINYVMNLAKKKMIILDEQIDTTLKNNKKIYKMYIKFWCKASLLNGKLVLSNFIIILLCILIIITNKAH